MDALDVTRFVVGIGSRPEKEKMAIVATGNDSSNVLLFDTLQDIIEEEETAFDIAKSVCVFEPEGRRGFYLKRWPYVIYLNISYVKLGTINICEVIHKREVD